jgi:hypothetical protein
VFTVEEETNGGGLRNPAQQSIEYFNNNDEIIPGCDINCLCHKARGDHDDNEIASRTTKLP